MNAKEKCIFPILEKGCSGCIRILVLPGSEHSEGVLISIFPKILSFKLYQESASPLHKPHPLDICVITSLSVTKLHTFNRLIFP